MIIGIMSDTHGDMAAIRRAVAAAGPVDMWLHGGDYSQDSNFLAELTGLPVTAVRGNCDGAVDTKLDEYIEIGQLRLWLTHGHRFEAKERIAELAWWADRYAAKVVIFGHTHVALTIWQNEILVINPGSPSRPRGGGPPSCAILEIGADQVLTARIVQVPKK